MHGDTGSAAEAGWDVPKHRSWADMHEEEQQNPNTPPAADHTAAQESGEDGDGGDGWGHAKKPAGGDRWGHADEGHAKEPAGGDGWGHAKEPAGGSWQDAPWPDVASCVKPHCTACATADAT